MSGAAPALRAEIERAWERRESLSSSTGGAPRHAIEEVIGLLDEGALRAAEKAGGEWRVHAWVKQAILLYFRLCDAKLMSPGGAGPWYDKIPLKFGDWDEAAFRSVGVRAVPGAVVRRGAFIGRDAVVMPSFVNIGAYVGEETMVDTWATVGSCAQVGRSVHISGGAGIGGVLEPLQAAPTIIEDGCFIGARSEIAEGVIVGQGAVISMGVFITASTPIVDRKTGEARRGFVPPYSVVLPGTLPSPHGEAALACAVIIKTVDERTRSKTSINELLRD